jgi:hypothetical protein
MKKMQNGGTGNQKIKSVYTNRTIGILPDVYSAEQSQIKWTLP